ncbi:MAG TPA: zinc ribbon domain-containing protein [Longimicrobium sp.]
MSVETPEQTFVCPRCGAEYAEGDSCPACGALRESVPCDDDASKPAHSRCVICGRALCDGDDEPLPARCVDHRHIPVFEGWAQVYTNNDELSARLLVENLRAEGIDAQLYSQADRSFPMDLGEMSIARVLVPVWEFQHALELIESYMDTEGEVTFACPSCGEVYEPGAEVCASCGAPLTA